ncbi:glycosyltransferase, partial [Frankia sp. EI5c]|uniref:glycosyltransferase n=1 Tax=Frankia sp. EI5c TaxID=683316 RepID=UPI001F5B47A5
MFLFRSFFREIAEQAHSGRTASAHSHHSPRVDGAGMSTDAWISTRVTSTDPASAARFGKPAAASGGGIPQTHLIPGPRGEQLFPVRPVLDVVIPVFNEENDLAPCVRRLHEHLRTTFPYPFQITVADNASTDGTLAIAQALEQELPEVSVMHLDAKGRGRALRAAWGISAAPVLAYMDVDLSTDLAALLPLVAPLISG